MPDVDGDGLDDVLEIDYAPHRFVARDGRTGRVLWSLSSSDLHLAEYARLGTPARPALLTQMFHTDATGITTSGVVALDARTGKTLWSFATSAVAQNALVAYGEAGVTYEEGVLAHSHGADDVLVGTATDTSSLIASGFVVTPRVINGATGVASNPGLPIVSDGIPGLFPLPDLNGDGVPDYALAADGTNAQLSVRNGATGGSLWDKITPATQGFISYVLPLPNAAGRGKPGLLAVNVGFGSASPVTAYAGSTGAVLWSGAPADAFPVEDIDHDGTPDIVMFGMDGFGQTLTAVSGRTGRRLWTTSISLPSANVDASLTLLTAGDLDGDHITDFLAQINTTGQHPTAEQIVISGRTGRQHAFSNLLGTPLQVPLRGRGAALIDTTGGTDHVTVTARDLAGVIWTRHYPIQQALNLYFLDNGHLRPTDGHDVLASLYGPDGSDLVALDGHTGKLLWHVHVA